MRSINQITDGILKKKGLAAFFQPQVDSTNAWAKRDFQSQAPLQVYLADEQSQGRGRGNNTWTQADPGATLLSSWCLRLHQTPQPLFPLRIGMALYTSCVSTWPQLDWALKAPNDIYIRDGKWAGILIELTSSASFTNAIIGIGANIFGKPEGLSQKTACLQEELLWTETDWSHFCHIFLQELFEIQKDPARTTLLKNEINSLESALKKYIGNAIKILQPDGTLILQDNTSVHWSEL